MFILAHTTSRWAKIVVPLRAVGSELTEVRVSGRQGFLGLLRSLGLLTWYCLKRTPDVLLTDHAGMHAFVAWAVSRAFSVPLVIRLKGDEWQVAYDELEYYMEKRRMLDWAKGWLKLRCWTVAAARAAGLVVVSDFLRTKVLSRLNRDILVFSVPPPTITDCPRRDSSEQGWGHLVQSRHVLLTVSTFSFRRKARALAQGIKQLAGFLRSREDTVWLIAGTGEYLQEIAECVSVSSLDDKVILLGFIQDVSSVYALADVFLYFSLEDSWSNVVVEAQLHGLPIIVNDHPVLVQFVQDGHDGFVVPLCRPDILQERLTRLLSDVRLREEMGERAKRKARQMPNCTEVGNDLVMAIDTIIRFRRKASKS